jgi:hypothetical protein
VQAHLHQQWFAQPTARCHFSFATNMTETKESKFTRFSLSYDMKVSHDDSKFDAIRQAMERTLLRLNTQQWKDYAACRLMQDVLDIYNQQESALRCRQTTPSASEWGARISTKIDAFNLMLRNTPEDGVCLVQLMLELCAARIRYIASSDATTRDEFGMSTIPWGMIREARDW